MCYGWLCLLGLGSAIQVLGVIRCSINGLSDELSNEKFLLLMFKAIEGAVEAAPSLVLTSYIIALSLFTELDAPEVVPVTWVS